MTATVSAPVTAPVRYVSRTDAVVARCAPVTLEEIQERADLQTRVDRKYVVPTDLFVELLEAHPHLGVLEIDGLRRFGYESVYFDTADLASYRGAAYGRRRRFKVRTRTYTDAGDCVFEVKVKGGRGETVKERLPYVLGDAATITPAAAAFAQEILHESLPDAVSLVRSLSPTLVTTYDRMTFVDAAAGTRLTCDTSLRCAMPDDDAHVTLDGQVVLESKSPGPATAIDRWLWARGRRPDQISKYCVGLAALDSDLPSNKWHRTLVRHFG